MVGMGLCDENDLTRRAISLAATCGDVFVEEHSIRLVDVNPKAISKALGRRVTVLDRKKIKNGTQILQAAQKGEAALLCGGDPGFAITHFELVIRAKKMGLDVRWIHAPTIFPATTALIGLSPYKFGRITVLTPHKGDMVSTTPLEQMAMNRRTGLHTLILLEPEISDGPPKHLLIPEALDMLERMEGKTGLSTLKEDTLMCGIARAGSIDPLVACGTMAQLRKVEWGGPLHTMVLPGKLDPIEVKGLVVLAGADERMLGQVSL